ncbi:MAG: sigma-54 dependent transcriptional regulator [Pseudomonadota bacterium]|nr:sigma-54 dependent transcriptional regulator [Pseudomonadota bacterium]
MTESSGLVILVDDDADVRNSTAQLLRLAGFDAMAFASAATALKYVSPSFEGVIVSDVRMPRIDGNELLALARDIDAEIPVIFITGHGDVRQAVEAVRGGAADYLEKPFQPEHLVASINRAMLARAKALEARSLRAAIDTAEMGGVLSGGSKRAARLREEIAQVAASDADVLVIGETGVGKGHVALAVHRMSARRRKPFVTLNCGSLSDASVGAELFGAEPGAAAGGYRRRVGRVEEVDGGDLLIDDVDFASPTLQNVLHALLSTRTIRVVGAASDTEIDFRAIATARPDLADLARRGAFRKDLYYCLDVVSVVVPPLRERFEDAPEIFASFLKQAEERFKRKVGPLSDAVRRRLAEHDWPGNLRELNAFAERVVLGFDSETPQPAEELPLPQRVEQFERGVIADALAAAEGDVRTAIKALGIPRKTFYDKLVRHGINLADFRPAKAPGKGEAG